MPGPGRRPSWVTGRVTEVLGGGWVEVEVPADRPETRATGPTDGLVTQVGALVRVLLDASGRVLQIASPTVLDPDRETRATGAAGALVQQAMTRGAQALREAEAVGQRAARAAEAAAEASREAARALAVGEANRPPHVGPTAPEKPVRGQIWYATRDDGAVIAASVWDGSWWLPRPLVASSVLVPGSVGDVSLADGAVTAPKIYASKELWARLAAFGSVTTEMLTAGGATITGTAVVGDLVGNRLRGGELALSDESTRSTETGAWAGVRSIQIQRSDRKEDGTVTATAAVDADGVTLTLTRPSTMSASSTWAAALFSAGTRPQGGTVRVSATVTVTTAAGTSDVRLHVLSQTRMWHQDKSPVRSGEPVTLTVTLPEGEYLDDTQLVNAQVLLGAGAQVGDTLRISNLRVEHVTPRRSGLRIYRDAAGTARIDITDGDDVVVSLSSAGVEMRGQAGTRLGAVGWRTLAAPPVASLRWGPSSGGDKPSGSYGYLDCRETSSEILRNGVYKSSYYVCVPISGWYRVDVMTSWAYAPAEPNWLVASGIWRSGRASVDDVHDPVDTRQLASGILTQPTASGVVHLDAGEGVCPAWWQNTGVWRPNGRAGSSMTVTLVAQD